jgi:hypothetical protein
MRRFSPAGELRNDSIVTSTSEPDDIRRLYAAFNRRDLDAVLDRLAEDAVGANGMEAAASSVARPCATTGRARSRRSSHASRPGR